MKGVKWLYQLRVGLNPLQGHKMKQNFTDTPDTDTGKCDVSKCTENIHQFFLHCKRFSEARCSLFNSVIFDMDVIGEISQD